MPIQDAVQQKGFIMPELVSLRQPKPDRDKEKSDSPVCDEYYEEFPYGTRIDLNDENVPGLAAKLPAIITAKAGDEMMLIAKVRVRELSTRETDEKDGKKKRHSIELQITDMNLSSDEALDDVFATASE